MNRVLMLSAICMILLGGIVFAYSMDYNDQEKVYVATNIGCLKTEHNYYSWIANKKLLIGLGYNPDEVMGLRCPSYKEVQMYTHPIGVTQEYPYILSSEAYK